MTAPRTGVARRKRLMEMDSVSPTISPKLIFFKNALAMMTAPRTGVARRKFLMEMDSVSPTIYLGLHRNRRHHKKKKNHIAVVLLLFVILRSRLVLSFVVLFEFQVTCLSPLVKKTCHMKCLKININENFRCH